MTDIEEQNEAKVVFIIPFDEKLGTEYKVGQEIPAGEFNQTFRNLKIPKVHGDKVYFYLRFNDGYVLRKSVKFYEVVDDPLEGNAFPVMWLYNLLDSKTYDKIDVFLRQPDHSSPYKLFDILKDNKFGYSVDIDLKEGDYIGLQRNFSKTEMTKYGKVLGAPRSARSIYTTSLQVEDGKLKEVGIWKVIPQLVSKVVRHTNKSEYTKRKPTVYHTFVFPLISDKNASPDMEIETNYVWDEDQFMDYYDVTLPGFYPLESLVMITPSEGRPIYYLLMNRGKNEEKVNLKRVNGTEIEIPIWSFDTYNVNDEALIDDLEDDKLTVEDLKTSFGLNEDVNFKIGNYILLLDRDGYMFYGLIRGDMSIEFLKDFDPVEEFKDTGVTKKIDRLSSERVNITAPVTRVPEREYKPRYTLRPVEQPPIVPMEEPVGPKEKKAVKFAEGTKPGSRQTPEKEVRVLQGRTTDEETYLRTFDVEERGNTDDGDADAANVFVPRVVVNGPLTENQTEQVINSLKFDDSLKFDGVRKFSLRGSYLDGRKRKTIIIPYTHRYIDLDDDLYLTPDEAEVEKEEAIKVLRSRDYLILNKNESYYKKELDYISYLEY